MPLSPERAFGNVLPALTAAELLLRKNAAQHGITYDIADFGALRTQADTARILKYRDDDYAVYLRSVPPTATPIQKEKWRPIAPYGSSYHNYGGAFDVVVTGVPAGRDLAWGLTMLQHAAPAVGLRSGVSFGDPPHFELPLTLDEVKDQWQLYTGTPNSGSSSAGVLLAVAAIGGLVFLAIRALRHRAGA